MREDLPLTGEAEITVRAAPDWFSRHSVRLLLSVRIVVAALATFAIAHLLGLKQNYWAVLTAVIVMQASVGGALKAIVDRLVGSLGGAVWGVVICLAIPHRDVASLALALVLGVGPLAVATAFNPAWRIAPVTAIILLLAPSGQAVGPVAAAFSRMLEVGIGSIVAVVVAMTLAPSRATSNLAAAAGAALTAMAELIEAVMAGLTEARDPESLEPLYARIRVAMSEADAAAAEVARERFLTLAPALDPAPLCRTLRRLYHDLIMAARATTAPLPDEAARRLEASAVQVSRGVAGLMREASHALTNRPDPPNSESMRRALTEFTEAIAGLRSSGATRGLPDEAVARLFGLTFALDQMGANLDDLIARVRELRPSRA
jgi:uncharacterized membrane protein YccC